jgi:hypothetical protein
MAQQDLTINFKVNDQGTAALEKIKSSVGGIQSAMKLVDASAITYLGNQAIAATEKIFDFTKAIADTGMEISRMAMISGLGVEKWQQWAGAAYLANVEQESLARGLKLLSRSMSDTHTEGSKANEAFHAMGLSVADAGGKTKGLDVMISEIADKFKTYEDGANKTALALALFGRSGQAMIPMLDRGSEGIKALREETERLNAVIGKDTVKALTDAEESYRKWTLMWQASKTEFWAPMVQMFTTLLEKIMGIKGAIASGDWGSLPGKIQGLANFFSPVALFNQQMADQMIKQYEQQVAAEAGATPQRIKDWVAAWKPTGEAPRIVNPDNPLDIPGFSMKRLNEQIRMLEAQGKATAGTAPAAIWGGEEPIGVKPGEMAIHEEGMVPEGWIVKIKDYEASLKAVDEASRQFIDTTEAAGPTEEQGIRIAERSKALADSRAESFNHLAQQYALLTGDTVTAIAADKAMEDQFIANNNLTDQQIVLIRQLGAIRRTEMTQTAQYVQDLYSASTSTINQNLASALTGQMTWADAMKRIWTDLASHIIQQILLIAEEQALLGGAKNVASAWSGGTGLVGLIGSLFHQEGGIFNQPTLGVIGEAGPEAVIPLRGGKIPVEGGQARGPTYLEYNTFQVFSDDPNSWEQKHAGQVIKVIQTNARKGGEMKQIVRGLM